MAILEIVKAGDPGLKQECEIVDKIDSKIRKLLTNMAETMYKADGVGLAAPQIGVNKCIVVMDVGDENGLIEMVNPEIVEKEGSMIDSEGCLSVPNVFGDGERFEKVTVE